MVFSESTGDMRGFVPATTPRLLGQFAWIIGGFNGLPDCEPHCAARQCALDQSWFPKALTEILVY